MKVIFTLDALQEKIAVGREFKQIQMRCMEITRLNRYKSKNEEMLDTMSIKNSKEITRKYKRNKNK